MNSVPKGNIFKKKHNTVPGFHSYSKCSKCDIKLKGIFLIHCIILNCPNLVFL